MIFIQGPTGIHFSGEGNFEPKIKCNPNPSPAKRDPQPHDGQWLVKVIPARWKTLARNAVQMFPNMPLSFSSGGDLGGKYYP